MITTNLIKFALATIFLTLVFRFALSYGIETKSNLISFLAASFYAISMFISGWFFGKKEYEYLPIHDMGFRFHLCTFLIHSIVSELWFLLKFNATRESVVFIHYYVAIWLTLLITHYTIFVWSRKHAIKNLDKEDLFEWFYCPFGKIFTNVLFRKTYNRLPYSM